VDTADGILGTNMYAYCHNDPVNSCDTGGYYKYDIHFGKHDKDYDVYYGTYYWAGEYFESVFGDTGAGKKKAWDYAETFAKANANVDTGATDPIANWTDRAAQSWHFNIYFFAKAGSDKDSRTIHYEESMTAAFGYLFMAGITTGSTRDSYINSALKAAGRGLHAKQDMIVHKGLGDFNVGFTNFQFPWGVDEVTYKVVDGVIIGGKKFNAAKDATDSVLRLFIGMGRGFNLW